jgi:hypothetical protein
LPAPQASFAADFRVASGDDAVALAESLGELQPLEVRIE